MERVQPNNQMPALHMAAIDGNVPHCGPSTDKYEFRPVIFAVVGKAAGRREYDGTKDQVSVPSDFVHCVCTL